MSAVLFWGSWIHLNAFRLGLDILLGPAIVVEASPAATAGNANKSRLQCYTVIQVISTSRRVRRIYCPFLIHVHLLCFWFCFPALQIALLYQHPRRTRVQYSPHAGKALTPLQDDKSTRKKINTCIYLWCPEIQRSARNQCKSQFQKQCEESCMFLSLSLFFKACQPSRRQKAFHLWVKAQVVGQLLPAGVSQED